MGFPHLLKVCFAFMLILTGLGIAANASGGIISYSGSYTIHTFTSSGTFSAFGNGFVQVLAVGGGGGGSDGGNFGGGGGAGQAIYNSSFPITAGNYSVIVGTGGGHGLPGSTGLNSVLAHLTRAAAMAAPALLAALRAMATWGEQAATATHMAVAAALALQALA